MSTRRAATNPAIKTTPKTAPKQADSPPRMRVGIGGWTFEPWRGVFYPEGLAQKRELEYASRQLTTIEVNGTFYGSQKPATFAKWHDETPDDFVFSLKAPRFATNRRVLSEAGDSIERFFASGLSELKDKLGPINWQFMPTKKFDVDDFAGFLKLLPGSIDGRRIRHAVEVRHESFRSPDFIALAREHGVAVVTAADSGYPQIADLTAPFVYARLQRSAEAVKTGYTPAALDDWAARARSWSKGGTAEGLALVGAAERKPPKSRDVFIYMINGFKPNAPAAALALIELVSAAKG